MGSIPLRSYSKSELRVILKDPSVNPAAPPRDFVPMNERRFGNLVRSIYENYKSSLKKMNFSFEDYKRAKILPVALVRIILEHEGLKYLE